MQQEKTFTLSELRLAFYHGVYIDQCGNIPPFQVLELEFKDFAEFLEAKKLAFEASLDDCFFELSDEATATEHTTQPAAV